MPDKEGYSDSTNFRFVLSIREDDLFYLENAIDKNHLAKMKQNRYRLTALEYKDAQKVIFLGKESLEKGLEAVIPWTPIGDMGHAVHQHALANGYTVVKEIGGHGCGNAFHEEPYVSFVSKPGTGMLMVPGMVFTIEPMVNMGKDEIFIDEENDWTVYTADMKPSAQWEVELLVTEDGPELLCW